MSQIWWNLRDSKESIAMIRKKGLSERTAPSYTTLPEPYPWAPNNFTKWGRYLTQPTHNLITAKMPALKGRHKAFLQCTLGLYILKQEQKKRHSRILPPPGNGFTSPPLQAWKAKGRPQDKSVRTRCCLPLGMHLRVRIPPLHHASYVPALL